MKKSLNRLFEIVVFTGLIMMITYLLATGKVILYLHPKMIKYLVFALIALVAIDGYWIWSFLNESKKYREFNYGTMVFLIPLLLILTNPTPISGAVMHNKSANLSMVTNQNPLNSKSVVIVEEDTSLAVVENQEEVVKEEVTSEESSVDETQIDESKELEASDESDQLEVSDEAVETAEEVITEDAIAEETPNDTIEENVVEEATSGEESDIIEIDDYYTFLVDIYSNPDLYNGKRVAIEGFAFRQENFQSNTVMLGRMIIACCAADAYVSGAFVKYPEASELETDSWYRIIGVVEEGVIYNPYTDENQMSMVVRLESYEAIEAYDNPYIYSN